MTITKQKEKPVELVQATLKKTKDGPAVVKPSGKTSATPDTSRQVSLHVSSAAAKITAMTSAMTSFKEAGFVNTRTSSGGSLGSLAQYAMDWNSADLDEVTSGNPKRALHPGSPSILAQKMHAARAALAEADKTAEVITLRLSFTTANIYIYISSPRDSS